MGNNVFEPIPSALNQYLLKYNQTTLNNTTPAAPGGNTNVTFQSDQFGNISAYIPAVNIETNGAPNTSQTVLNIKNGTNITVTSDGVGGVTINTTAAPTVQISSGSTLTVSSTDVAVFQTAGGGITLPNTNQGPGRIVSLTNYSGSQTTTVSGGGAGNTNGTVIAAHGGLIVAYDGVGDWFIVGSH